MSKGMKFGLIAVAVIAVVAAGWYAAKRQQTTAPVADKPQGTTDATRTSTATT